MQAVTRLHLEYAAPRCRQQLVGGFAELPLITARSGRPQSSQTLRVSVEFILQSRRFRTMLAIDQQRILFVGQEDTSRVEVVRQLLAARGEAVRRELGESRETPRLQSV